MNVNHIFQEVNHLQIGHSFSSFFAMLVCWRVSLWFPGHVFPFHPGTAPSIPQKWTQQCIDSVNLRRDQSNHDRIMNNPYLPMLSWVVYPWFYPCLSHISFFGVAFHETPAFRISRRSVRSDLLRLGGIGLGRISGVCHLADGWRHAFFL